MSVYVRAQHAPTAEDLGLEIDSTVDDYAEALVAWEHDELKTCQCGCKVVFTPDHDGENIDPDGWIAEEHVEGYQDGFTDMVAEHGTWNRGMSL